MKLFGLVYKKEVWHDVIMTSDLKMQIQGGHAAVHHIRYITSTIVSTQYQNMPAWVNSN